MRRKRIVGRALAFGVSSILVVGACSDDSGSKTAATAAAAVTTVAPGGASTGSPSSGGSPAAATAAPTAHAPYKVMVTGDFTSATLAYTVEEAVPAVKSVLASLPGITIETCDSKGDANTATACERKAVSDGVVAVIASFGNIAQDQAILTQAGIPVLDQVKESEANSFSLASSVGGYVGIGIAMANAGCTKLGILQLDGTDYLGDAIRDGMKSKGGKEVARASIPINAPDLAPAVAKLLGAGPECIALSVAPPQVIQAVTAIDQTGKKLLVGGTGAIFLPDVLKALGSKSEGLITVEMAAGANDPAVANIKAAQAAVDPKAKFSSQSVYAWISAMVLKAGINSVQGDLTKANLLAAMNGLQSVDVGAATHPISMVELKAPAFKRWFNHYSVAYLIKGGVPVRSGDFFDVGPAMESR
ncbi:MAG: putative substrate-binding transporter protein component [Acidimicrobiia bacterium]|nr:putative substrate-binding transporter protein component [Acidimicrobiia bacterium]